MKRVIRAFIVTIILNLLIFSNILEAADIKNFTATWDANAADENILGYNLYWKWGAETLFERKINGAVLISPSSNIGYKFQLDVGGRAEVDFALTAVNANGESDKSNVVKIDLNKPGIPKNLKIILQLIFQ